MGLKRTKKYLTIKDMSGYTNHVRLCGQHYDNEGRKIDEIYSSSYPLILAIKGGRVVEFNGKIIGTVSNRTLLINPSILETNELQTWFRSTRSTASSLSLNKKYTMSSN